MSQELIYHDDLVAVITQQLGGNGIYRNPYAVVTIKTIDGKVLVCEPACDVAEARRWVNEQFKFPSSILILQHSK